jgi:RNA polymerase sigma factor (sigma-70 family)
MVAAILSPSSSCAEIDQEATDKELLTRFVEQQDESAFAEVVRRHSRTVWGVCHRLLTQKEDAEDAFQAVFAVLARKAGTIRKGEALGSWLYGVAYRTARQARRQAIRRREHQAHPRLPSEQAPAWSEAAYRELLRMLDEEVQRLAPKYRMPFVLCCLEGLSKEEAARKLGWKEGTLSGRLAKAHQRLKEQLARRGVLLSGVLTAVALAQKTAAAPAGLVHSTIHGVMPHLGGKVTAKLSPQALALANQLLHATAATKVVFTVASALLSATILIGGVSLAALQDGTAPAQPNGAPPAVRAPIAERILTLAYSPDGKQLVTGGGVKGEGPAGGFTVRPVPKQGGGGGAQVRRRAGQGEAVRVVPGQGGDDGTQTVGVSFGHLETWKVDTGKLQLSPRPIGGIRAAAFSPDGRTLAIGMFSGELKLLSADTAEVREQTQAHENGVNGISFSPDGTMLASAGHDQTIKLWDMEGLKLRKVLSGHSGAVISVAFFHNGRNIVSGSKDATAKIWDVQNGNVVATLQGHQSGIQTVAVSRDDKLIATASRDKTMRLWHAETGKEAAVLKGSDDGLFAAAFDPDGKLLAGGAADGTIILWDVMKRSPVSKLNMIVGTVWALSFSPDGSHLASGSDDGKVIIWDVPPRTPTMTLSTPGVPAYFPRHDDDGLESPPGSKEPKKLARPEAEAQLQRAIRATRGLEPNDPIPNDPTPGVAMKEDTKSSSKLWLIIGLALVLPGSYLIIWLYLRKKRFRARKEKRTKDKVQPV